MKKGQSTETRRSAQKDIMAGLQDAAAAKADQQKPRGPKQINPTQTDWGDVTDQYNEDGRRAIENGWITADGLLMPAGQDEIDRKLRVVMDIDKKAREQGIKERRDAEIRREQQELDKKRQELLGLLRVYFVASQLPNNIVKITKLQNDIYMLVIYLPDSKTKLLDKKGTDPMKVLEDTIEEVRRMLKDK